MGKGIDKEILMQELGRINLAIEKMQIEDRNEIDELEKLLIEDEYEDSEGNFYEFFKSSWSYFDPEPYKDNWHLQCMAEHAQACIEGVSDLKNLLVTIPPRNSKSKIFSVALPAWAWGPAKRPQEKFITASYTQSLSTELCVNSRQLMNHPWYRQKWMTGGDGVFDFSSDGNTKTRIDNNVGGYRVTTTPGGAALGLGFSVCIIDDPLNAKQANSDTYLQSVLDWYRGAIKNRANDPLTARTIVIMQRLAEQDLAGYILENEHQFFHLNIPEEFEKQYTFFSPIDKNDPRTTEGQLLWPERFDEDFIEEQKKDPYSYAAKYQQRPAPLGGGIIKRDWLQTYYEVPLYFDTLVSCFDLSMVDSDNADYTVGTVWGKIDGDIYLIDMIRNKMSVIEQIEAILYMERKYPQCRAKLIEAKANGPAVIKMLEKKISGIIAIEPSEYGGNKQARLHACVPEFASKSVKFPDVTIAPWIDDVVSELMMFPKGKHDDIVDTIAYAISWLSLNHMGSKITLNQDMFHNKNDSLSDFKTYFEPTNIKQIKNFDF